MSSQKKISSFFMKKANDETIQPGSAGDQGSEELKTGAVADVDVKVIPLESNEPETLMPSSLPAKHLQGMISWMNDSDKIQSSYGTDLRAIIEARRATSKGIVQESSSRDFRMPSPTIGDEDSASCDHVETILESGDVTDVFPKGPGALRRPMTADVSCQVFSYPPSPLDDDDESVVSGSTVSSIYSTDGQGEGDVTDEFPNCTVSSIYSTDGQGEGDVTDVFPKGPGDGRDDEVTAGSGADFPGLRSFLAEDEAEEEEETEVTLVQHAAQTSPIIVHKAYYASSCGSL